MTGFLVIMTVIIRYIELIIGMYWLCMAIKDHAESKPIHNYIDKTRTEKSGE